MVLKCVTLHVKSYLGDDVDDDDDDDGDLMESTG